MHKEQYKPIKFPIDELAHNHIIEWWYFNGHLKDKDCNEYSFMNCLFRVDVKKVNLPFLSKIPLKTSYFSHSLITDLANKKFYHRIAPFSVISADSFSKPSLYVNYFNPEIENFYINCVIERIDEFRYRVKNEDIDLVLTSIKEPLFEGGRGYVDLGPKTSYYYSLTNLKTEGRIKVKNKWVNVSGKSWMDHQWANMSYTFDKWDWFSVQLEGGTEMVCYMYDYKGQKTYAADISYANGKREHYREGIEIIAQERRWTSPKSKASYPLSWKIKIPRKNIELILEAKIDNQEMLFGSINYWEGPLSVSGNFENKKVKGDGFMELLGYPSQYSNVKYISDEIGKTAKWFIGLAKDKAFGLTSEFKKKISG